MSIVQRHLNLDSPSHMEVPVVRVIGSLNRVRHEFEERYTVLHRHTFPEVLKRIRDSNLTHYSIFLREGLLFSYLEYAGRDYQEDMKALGRDEATRDWWKLTDPMQDPLPERPPSEWWANMDLLYLDGTLGASKANSNRLAFVASLSPKYQAHKSEMLNSLKDLPLHIRENISINKVAFFSGYGKVCLYLDICGLLPDVKTGFIETVRAFKDSSLDMRRYLATDWQEMSEVFYNL